jgi:hypothetical protein
MAVAGTLGALGVVSFHLPAALPIAAAAHVDDPTMQGGGNVVAGHIAGAICVPFDASTMNRRLPG